MLPFIRYGSRHPLVSSVLGLASIQTRYKRNLAPLGIQSCRSQFSTSDVVSLLGSTEKLDRERSHQAIAQKLLLFRGSGG
jgi:hypothetical protein